MKLTESKLKQLIREAMEIPPLPHVDKIANALAKSFEDGKAAAAIIDSHPDYITKYDSYIDDEYFRKSISINFRHPSQAQELHSALESEMTSELEYPRVESYLLQGTYKVEVIYYEDPNY